MKSVRDKIQGGIESYGMYFFSIWILACVFLLQFCSTKYEVVQKLDTDIYHLQGIKNKDVIIVKAQKKLKDGDVVKLKDLDIYEIQ